MKRIDRDKVAPGVAAVGTLAVGGLAFALSFTALAHEVTMFFPALSPDSVDNRITAFE